MQWIASSKSSSFSSSSFSSSSSSSSNSAVGNNNYYYDHHAKIGIAHSAVIILQLDYYYHRHKAAPATPAQRYPVCINFCLLCYLMKFLLSKNKLDRQQNIYKCIHGWVANTYTELECSERLWVKSRSPSKVEARIYQGPILFCLSPGWQPYLIFIIAHTDP